MRGGGRIEASEITTQLEKGSSGDLTTGSNSTKTLQEDHIFRSQYEERKGIMDVTVIGSNTTETPGSSVEVEGNITCTNNCFLFGLLRERPLDILVVIRMLFSLLLFACSCLTILVTRRSTKLKERQSAIFVTNLAVTGGLIGFEVFLFSTAHQINQMSRRNIALTLVLIPRVLHAVTTLTLTCLTLDRYLALCWPLRYPALLTDARCLQLVLGSWLLPAVVLGMACIFGKGFTPCPDVRPYLITYLVVFTSAISAVVWMYTLIAREFHRPIGGAVGGEELAMARRRTARELMVVVMMNLLLATPDVGTKLYLLTCPTTLPELYHVAPVLLLAHLICFYPLYTWKNRDFRSAAKDVCASFKGSCGRVLSRVSCKMSFVRDSITRVSLSSMSSGRMSSTATAATNTTAISASAPADGAPVSVEKELSAIANPTFSISSSSSSSSSISSFSPLGQDNVTFQS